MRNTSTNLESLNNVMKVKIMAILKGTMKAFGFVESGVTFIFEYYYQDYRCQYVMKPISHL